MRARFPVVAIRPALLTAVFTGLLVAGEGRSRQKNPNGANTAAKQAVKIEEAAVLNDAYVLMAMANHDYAGHRAKAMEYVEYAIKRLDGSVMKNGTNSQKVVAARDEIDTARAKFLAQRRGTLPKGQALSDLQMREALQLISRVYGAASVQKQPKIHEQVGNAIEQINISPAIK
jgi:hypothetical protein